MSIVMPVNPAQIAIERTEESLVSSQGLFLHLVFSHSLVLFVMWMFGDTLSRAGSLFAVSLASLAGVISLYIFYLRKTLGTRALSVVLSAFALRLVVGIVHYVLFMQSNYFESSVDFSYFWDFEWMHQSMIIVSDSWANWGLLSPLPASYFLENKNPYLIAYNALIYFFNGANSLNIAPWNSLHSIYTAIIVGALALRLGASKNQAILALAIAAFQPFGFISSIMWRDSVGQFWLILGVYLLISTRDKKYLWVMILPAACFFAWSYRQPYMAIILVLAAYILSTAYEVRITGWLIITFAIVVSIITSFFPILFELNFSRFTGTRELSLSPFLFPIRLVRGFAGPFPWYQVFMGVNGVEYMLADFLQAVYNLTLVIFVIPIARKMWQETSQLDPSLLSGALLFIVGTQATGVHMPYVSAGIVLLLPLACQVDYRSWSQTFLQCFYGFIIANILYWMLGLTGSGVLQGITGY